MFIGGLFAAAMPVVHFNGGRRMVAIAAGDGGFFFIWNVLTVGTVGIVVMILSAYELWSTRKGSLSADQYAAKAASTII